MEIKSILAAIDSEIARLKLARAALSSEGEGGSDLQGVAVSGNRTNIRTFSPDARRRIAEAQRRRWTAARSRAPESASVKHIGTKSETDTDENGAIPF